MGIDDTIFKVVVMIKEFITFLIKSIDDLVDLIINSIDDIESFILKILDIFLETVELLINYEDLYRIGFMMIPVIPLGYMLLLFIESF